MRGVICICVFALIALFCIVTYVQLQSGIESLENQVAEVAIALEQENWQQAEEMTQQITRRWQRKQNFYSLFARHQLYEPVSIGMRVLPELIARREKDAYITALRLREELYLLRETETFTWRNVL